MVIASRVIRKTRHLSSSCKLGSCGSLRVLSDPQQSGSGLNLSRLGALSAVTIRQVIRTHLSRHLPSPLAMVVIRGVIFKTGLQPGLTVQEDQHRFTDFLDSADPDAEENPRKPVGNEVVSVQEIELIRHQREFETLRGPRHFLKYTGSPNTLDIEINHLPALSFSKGEVTLEAVQFLLWAA